MKVIGIITLSIAAVACQREQSQQECATVSGAAVPSVPVVGQSAANAASTILLAFPWDLYPRGTGQDSLARLAAAQLRNALGDSVAPTLLFLTARIHESAMPAASMYVDMGFPSRGLEDLVVNPKLSYLVRSIAYRALAELEAPEQTLWNGNGPIRLSAARQQYICEVAQAYLQSPSDSVYWILHAILERMPREAQKNPEARRFLQERTIKQAQTQLREWRTTR